MINTKLSKEWLEQQLGIWLLITPDISRGWGQAEGKCVLHVLFSQEHSRHIVKSLGLAPQPKQRSIKKIHEQGTGSLPSFSNGKPCRRQEHLELTLSLFTKDSFICFTFIKFQGSEIPVECYKKLFSQTWHNFSVHLLEHSYFWTTWNTENLLMPWN